MSCQESDQIGDNSLTRKGDGIFIRDTNSFVNSNKLCTYSFQVWIWMNKWCNYRFQVYVWMYIICTYGFHVCVCIDALVNTTLNCSTPDLDSTNQFQTKIDNPIVYIHRIWHLNIIIGIQYDSLWTPPKTLFVCTITIHLPKKWTTNEKCGHHNFPNEQPQAIFVSDIIIKDWQQKIFTGIENSGSLDEIKKGPERENKFAASCFGEF